MKRGQWVGNFVLVNNPVHSIRNLHSRSPMFLEVTHPKSRLETEICRQLVYLGIAFQWKTCKGSEGSRGRFEVRLDCNRGLSSLTSAVNLGWAFIDVPNWVKRARPLDLLHWPVIGGSCYPRQGGCLWPNTNPRLNSAESHQVATLLAAGEWLSLSWRGNLSSNPQYPLQSTSVTTHIHLLQMISSPHPEAAPPGFSVTFFSWRN